MRGKEISLPHAQTSFDRFLVVLKLSLQPESACLCIGSTCINANSISPKVENSVFIQLGFHFYQLLVAFQNFMSKCHFLHFSLCKHCIHKKHLVITKLNLQNCTARLSSKLPHLVFLSCLLFLKWPVTVNSVQQTTNVEFHLESYINLS